MGDCVVRRRRILPARERLLHTAENYAVEAESKGAVQREYAELPRRLPTSFRVRGIAGVPCANTPTKQPNNQITNHPRTHPIL